MENKAQFTEQQSRIYTANILDFLENAGEFWYGMEITKKSSVSLTIGSSQNYKIVCQKSGKTYRLKVLLGVKFCVFDCPDKYDEKGISFSIIPKDKGKGLKNLLQYFWFVKNENPCKDQADFDSKLSEALTLSEGIKKYAKNEKIEFLSNLKGLKKLESDDYSKSFEGLGIDRDVLSKYLFQTYKTTQTGGNYKTAKYLAFPNDAGGHCLIKADADISRNYQIFVSEKAGMTTFFQKENKNLCIFNDFIDFLFATQMYKARAKKMLTDSFNVLIINKTFDKDKVKAIIDRHDLVFESLPTEMTEMVAQINGLSKNKAQMAGFKRIGCSSLGSQFFKEKKNNIAKTQGKDSLFKLVIRFSNAKSVSYYSRDSEREREDFESYKANFLKNYDKLAPHGYANIMAMLDQVKADGGLVNKETGELFVFKSAVLNANRILDDQGWATYLTEIN